MEINVDNLLKNVKNTENNKKETDKQNKKIKLKISKKPLNPPIRQQIALKEVSYIQIPEYIKGLEQMAYKLMSLPAKDRKEILEEKLKKSNDFRQLLKSNLIDNLHRLNLPYQAQLVLTWLYHYISTIYLDEILINEKKLIKNSNINNIIEQNDI
jgi:hypothetical protein